MSNGTFTRWLNKASKWIAYFEEKSKVTQITNFAILTDDYLHFQPVIYYGFVPLIVLIGLTMTTPRPSFLQLIIQ